MKRISRTRITACLRTHAIATATAREKGHSLENLVCHLFEAVPGISGTARNEVNPFHSEEVDVAFWNDQDANGVPFLPQIILVECKNWSAPAGAPELSWFKDKVLGRGLDFGVFVALGGITGSPAGLTAAHKVISDALLVRCRLVVLVRADIEGIGRTADFVAVLKKKLLQLAANGTTI